MPLLGKLLSGQASLPCIRRNALAQVLQVFMTTSLLLVTVSTKAFLGLQGSGIIGIIRSDVIGLADNRKQGPYRTRHQQMNVCTSLL